MERNRRRQGNTYRVTEKKRVKESEGGKEKDEKDEKTDIKGKRCIRLELNGQNDNCKAKGT